MSVAVLDRLRNRYVIDGPRSPYGEHDDVFPAPTSRKIVQLPRAPSESAVPSDYVLRLVDAKPPRQFPKIDKIPTSVVAAAMDAQKQNYPHALVRWFGMGLLLFVVGLVILLANIFFHAADANAVAAALLAVGSVTVVLTLLRGQDIDERTI